MRQEVGADALAGVAHDNLGTGVDDLEPYRDASALWSELDRVGEEVANHLLQTSRIPEHATAPEAAEHGLELDTLRRGRRTDDVHGCLDYLREIDGLRVNTQLARHHARDIEQVLDEVLLRLRAAFDRLESTRGLRGIELSPPQQVNPGEDRREG